MDFNAELFALLLLNTAEKGRQKWQQMAGHIELEDASVGLRGVLVDRNAVLMKGEVYLQCRTHSW